MIADRLVEIDGRTVRYCLYGPADGFPVISHNGTPSTRWKRPDLVEAMQQSGVRVLMPDRPGYGGSTRQRGRTVADVVGDVRVLADAQGWQRFAVLGGSGGGPHALACAALLPERVIRCAVVSGIRPPEAAEPPDEQAVRPLVEQVARDIMAKIADGGPEVPGLPGPPARDDPAALARLRATFVDSHDGWVDDRLALARPWGFEMPGGGAIPVGVWHGTHDETLPPEHAQWLLAHIPGARGYQYAGGHMPGADTFREIYGWLRGGAPTP